ncbi:hypothetical protein [uncultured Oscillibacter sp.]|uniref:hypothetical protein n=1 Tax=uncultured Oscillibacter sp. TaxID=876091 RepID=UPI0025DCE109|nr:hypothetical protein [uncultured Oscillibacter sp.]
MDKTAHLQLNLPGAEDYADIGVLNQNFETLDREVAEREQLLKNAGAAQLLRVLDKLPVLDSQDGFETKLVTLELLQSALKAAFDEAYAALSHTHNWTDLAGVPGSFTPAAHTHSKSQITDFPGSLPASDVYPWAKAASKPGYTAAEVGAVPVGASCNKNWVWSGQSGQPSWLWGSNDGTNMYVYNPSGFNVSSAGSAHVTANADPGTASLKNISAGTGDIGAGAGLATGQVYLVYE